MLHRGLVKPFVDANYRTLPRRENTMIMGALHGGLAAFYIANRRPDEFGFCKALSPSFWVGVDHAEGFPIVKPNDNATLRGSQLIAMVQNTLADARRRPRLYLDWGLVRTGVRITSSSRSVRRREAAKWPICCSSNSAIG